jgi:hypothetical protein
MLAALIRFLPATAFLLVAGLLCQEPTPRAIPMCKGAECHDEVTGSDHSDWPSWCQNQDANGYKANCHCQRESCDSKSRSSNCSRYCGERGCRCSHGCEKTR